nr:ATP-dependent Clp protease proteolytic subunit [Hydrococcus sp. Prado102]
TERDFYMSAQEAREYGLIDRVISRPTLSDPTVPVTSLR